MTGVIYTKVLSLTSIIFLLASLIVTGCSSKSESNQTVYDTKANPADFPMAALTLLDMIESDQLTSYNQITAGFGDLYLANSELLDDIKWREVIDRLGKQLHNRAEQYASDGPHEFDRAADYYRIAAFAQPDDKALQNKAEMFMIWSEAAEKGLLNGWNLPDSVWSIEHLVNTICRLAPDDEYDRKFVYEYLVPLAEMSDESTLQVKLAAMDLNVFQKAILKSVGLPVEFTSKPLATFESPPIDLIAFHIDSLPAHLHRLTLCFEPQEDVEYDLFVEVSEHNSSERSDNEEFRVGLPHTFKPDQPSTTWKKGDIVVVNGWLDEGDNLSLLKVGLFSQQLDQKHFLSIAQRKDNRYPIRVYPPEKQTSRF